MKSQSSIWQWFYGSIFTSFMRRPCVCSDSWKISSWFPWSLVSSTWSCHSSRHLIHLFDAWTITSLFEISESYFLLLLTFDFCESDSWILYNRITAEPSRRGHGALISSTGQFVSFFPLQYYSSVRRSVSFVSIFLSVLNTNGETFIPLVPVHPINSISWKDPWHIHSSGDFFFSFHITTTIVLLISPPSESILYLSPFFFPLLVWSLSVWHPTSLQFLISFLFSWDGIPSVRHCQSPF